MTAEKSDQSIRVVKRYGAVTGKEMFRVKGDPNAWCSTVEAAVSQYHCCYIVTGKQIGRAHV